MGSLLVAGPSYRSGGWLRSHGAATARHGRWSRPLGCRAAAFAFGWSDRSCGVAQAHLRDGSRHSWAAPPLRPSQRTAGVNGVWHHGGRPAHCLLQRPLHDPRHAPDDGEAGPGGLPGCQILEGKLTAAALIACRMRREGCVCGACGHWTGKPKLRLATLTACHRAASCYWRHGPCLNAGPFRTVGVGKALDGPGNQWAASSMAEACRAERTFQVRSALDNAIAAQSPAWRPAPLWTDGRGGGPTDDGGAPDAGSKRGEREKQSPSC